jgi:phospholipid transport system substrate-binding protein
MNHYRFPFIAVSIYIYGAILCLASISSANAALQLPGPTLQLRPFIEKLQSILTDPELQGEEKRVRRREKVMASASEHFDFHEMSKRVLGKTWRMLSKEEQEYFVTLFASLLKHAYITKIENYAKQKVEFKRQRIKGKRSQVITTLTDRNGTITVSYIMMLKNDVWKVYDIVVEGVSLVRNYMSQFREILRKEGYASLLKRVDEKVIELDPCNK